NHDGVVNVVDVQLIVDQALGIFPPISDINGDDVVNIIDVQLTVNAALGLGCRVSLELNITPITDQRINALAATLENIFGQIAQGQFTESQRLIDTALTNLQDLLLLP